MLLCISVNSQQVNGNRVIHRLNGDQNGEEQQEFHVSRNYENQLVNHMQQQQLQNRQTISGLSASQVTKPSVPNKPFMSQTRLNGSGNGNGEEGSQMLMANMASIASSASKIVSSKLSGQLSAGANGSHLNGLQQHGVNRWERQQQQAHEDEEENRFDLLRQRVELLQQLEAKPQSK